MPALPFMMPFLALAAVMLDHWLGELQRFHPLVGFGHLADVIEGGLRHGVPGHALGNRLRGLLGWLLLVAPLVLLALWLGRQPLGWLTDTLLLYLALGGKSLVQHGGRVAADLAANDLAAARIHVGWMVSRDTSQLDEEGVSRAAVESILENGNDAVFGALFWFFVAGGAGALLYRLANTLDAMWGYKDDRRIYFGWAAARIDDVLNLVPARLTALTYVVLGHTRTALACWRTQAGTWASPNAGPVIAAGAGAIQAQLGGAAVYHGQIEMRPKLGVGWAVEDDDGKPEFQRRLTGHSQLSVPHGAWPKLEVGADDDPKVVQSKVTMAHIHHALTLVMRGLWLWLGVAGAFAMLLVALIDHA